MCATPASPQLPSGRPTDWQIRADGHGVWRYEVQQLETANRLALGFLFPTDVQGNPARESLWPAALGATLRMRRQHDTYAAAFYGEQMRERLSAHTGDILKLSSQPRPALPTSEPSYAALNRALGALAPKVHPVYGTDLAEGPQRALRSLLELLDASQGDRHCFVVLDKLEGKLVDEFDSEKAAKQVTESDATLHVLLTPAAPAGFARVFRQLAAASGGAVLSLGDCSELTEVLADLVASIHRSHRLTFQLPAGASSLEIELASAKHQGKLALSASQLKRLQADVAA